MASNDLFRAILVCVSFFVPRKKELREKQMMMRINEARKAAVKDVVTQPAILGERSRSFCDGQPNIKLTFQQGQPQDAQNSFGAIALHLATHS